MEKLSRGSMLRRMGVGAGAVAASTLALSSPVSVVQAAGAAVRGTRLSKKPTIVLVHGAFAESASWNGSIDRLVDQGFPTIAAAVPLRSIAGDTTFVSAIVKSIKGPVVLVGHSYGGAIISSAGAENDNVKALVFVSGLAPEPGEKLGGAGGALPREHAELYAVQRAAGRRQQRPLYPARQVPSAVHGRRADRRGDPGRRDPAADPGYRVYGAGGRGRVEDATILVHVRGVRQEYSRRRSTAGWPQRAKAREVVEIKGAAHALPVSQPDAVADLILKATAYVESIG